MIQLVPYGRGHTNPPLGLEPAWDAPATRELTVRACYACHSNATTWPWYSNVAPASWLIQSDVDGGRDKVNFTDWATPAKDAPAGARLVRDGEMPPSQFLLLHPDARLTTDEQAALIRGLEATFGPEPPRGSGRGN